MPWLAESSETLMMCLQHVARWWALMNTLSKERKDRPIAQNISGTNLRCHGACSGTKDAFSEAHRALAACAGFLQGGFPRVKLQRPARSAITLSHAPTASLRDAVTISPLQGRSQSQLTKSSLKSWLYIAVCALSLGDCRSCTCTCRYG